MFPKLTFAIRHPLIVRFCTQLNPSVKSLLEARQLADIMLLVAWPDVHSKQGGCTPTAIREHEDLLARKINGGIANQTQEPVVQRTSVDVSKHLGQQQTAFTFVFPLSLEL